MPMLLKSYVSTQSTHQLIGSRSTCLWPEINASRDGAHPASIQVLIMHATSPPSVPLCCCHLVYTAHIQWGLEDLRRVYERIGEVAFSSERKCMEVSTLKIHFLD